MTPRIKLIAALFLIVALLTPCLAADMAAEHHGITAPNYTVKEETENTEAAAPEFSDISGHWAENTINKWRESGIVNGYPDGTFRPNALITRAELAKLITLAFDLKGTTGLKFNDLSEDTWYYSYIQTAADYIPTYGPPDFFETTMDYINAQGKSFLPDNAALRCHAAGTFAALKIDLDGISVDYPSVYDIKLALNDKYKDSEFSNLFVMHGSVADNVRQFFTDAWLSTELGLMQGDNLGYFRPYDGLTRAEALTIIDRMLG